MKNELTDKERLFCAYYARDGDARGCAARAGYAVAPARSAARLLEKESVKKEISRLEKGKKAVSCVETGFRRLAFGSVADAVKLTFLEKDFDERELERLDLFNVSEIKRPRGGGLEIKFFDRLKALEKLEGLDVEDDDARGGFIRALSEGAKLMSKAQSDEP